MDHLTCLIYTFTAIFISLYWFNCGGIVGIVTGYELDDRGWSSSPVRSRMFISPYRPDRLWGLPSLPSSGNRKFSLEVKRLGCIGDYNHLPTALIHKTWIYTSAPPYVFMAQYWVENFTLTSGLT
jgi:hypothetical protein